MLASVFILLLWIAVASGGAKHSADFVFKDVLSSDERGKFDPYADNGGTVVAIAGRDYCLIAADTRLCDGYVVRSREIQRMFEISSGVYFAAAGCWSDVAALAALLTAESARCEWESGHPLTVSALAHVLSSKLYTRRLFPFFSFCTMAGLDAEGCGAVYKYDAVGSFERVLAACSGKGEQMVQPMLDEATALEQDDELWALSEEEGVFCSHRKTVSLSSDEAKNLVLRAFRAAAEREISVGDGLHMRIIRKAGVQNLHFSLPRH